MFTTNTVDRPLKSHVRFRLVALLGTALAALAILATSATHTYTSDDVAQQNAVATLSVHSHRVLDLPQNTYVLKLPIYAALQLLPVTPWTRLFAVTLLLGLATFALFYWAAYSFVKMYAHVGLASLAPLLWLPSLGIAIGGVLIAPNSRNFEIGLAFASLTVMARWYRREAPLTDRRTVERAAVFAVTLGLLFFDDPYFAYLLAAPVLLVFGGSWLLFGEDKRALSIFVAMLAALASAKLWYWCFWLLGLHAGQGSGAFATLPAIARNAQLFVQGVLDLFNANIFGHPILSLETTALELNLLILATTMLSPFLLFYRSVRQDIWKVFMVLQPPLIAAAFIFSDEIVNAGSDRYLVLLPFYAALIFSVVIAGLVTPRVRNLLIAMILLAAILNVLATSHASLGGRDNPNAESQATARIAMAHHLTKGYASYWNAGINQYFADNKVLFIQSGCSRATGVKPYRQLLNEQALQRPAATSFYLYDPSATRCTEPDLVRFFGEAQSTVEIPGRKKLFVYGYDITKKMAAH